MRGETSFLCRLPLLGEIGIQPHTDVLLQVSIEELVIVQVVDAIGKEGQAGGIFLGGDVGDF